MEILLAVQDEDLGTRLEGLFRARQRWVTRVGSLEAALEAVGRDDYRMALLDHELGRRGVRRLAARIRARRGGEDTQILLLTGGNGVGPGDDELGALAGEGFDAFLPRELAPDALELWLLAARLHREQRSRAEAAEAELRRLGRRHQTLLETMHEGVVVVDPRGVIERLNSRFCEITGFDSNELLGEKADEVLVDPAVRRRLPGRRLLGAGAGSEEHSLPLRSKAAGERWVRLTAAPLSGSKRRRTLGVIQDLSEQRQVEEALKHREQYFRVLTENASDLLTILDLEGQILYQSPSVERILGWSPDYLIGRALSELVHQDDHAGFLRAFEHAIESPGATPPGDLRLLHADGEWRHLEFHGRNLLDNPVVGGLLLTLRDVTDRKRVEAELERERTFFRQLFRNSPAGIVVLDERDRVLDVNRAWSELFQYSLDEAKGRSLAELIVPENLRSEASELSQAVYRNTTVEMETLRRRRDGELIEVAILGYPIELAESRVGAYGIYTDITQRKRAERRLFHEAFHDPLTGLANRALFHEILQRMLRRTRRRPDYRFALLFVDLDHFKKVNDSLGHGVGDELLVETARRLEACLRPGDTLARLGGDEFLILLDDLKEAEDASGIAERCLAALGQPLEVEAHQLSTSASIGIAFGSPDRGGVEELLRDADAAMYSAKKAGKGRVHVFDESMRGKDERAEEGYQRREP